MGGVIGPVFGGVAGDSLGVDSFDPLDFPTETVAHGDCEPRVAAVLFISLRTPIKCISVVPQLHFQTHDVVLEGCDNGLMEDLSLPDGRHQAFGDPVEGDAVHIVMLEDVACQPG